jgi:hypothetical protein
VPWELSVQSGISLAVALVPAAIGVYAWDRRGTAGAVTLAALMWTLSLWGVLYATELMARGETASVLHELDRAALLPAAPLWFIFALRYTGRSRWLTPARVALIALVPLTTLGLMLAGEDLGAGYSIPPQLYGGWLWLDLAYGALLAIVGSALFILMLANSQRLYRLQSLCLLLGFLLPWAVATAHRLDPGPTPGQGPMILSFAASGLALLLGLYRYRLLDISPVAHDTVVEGMRDGTIVLDLRTGRPTRR